MRIFRLLLVLGVLGSLLGCATYQARSYNKKNLRQYSKFYIANNLDDNHHIDLLLAAAFRAEGFEVETGPHTMMPDDTDVVISYRDAWNWDFAEHIVALHLQARDAKYNYLLAHAEFYGLVTMKTRADEVTRRVLKDLLNAKPRVQPKPGASKAAPPATQPAADTKGP